MVYIISNNDEKDTIEEERNKANYETDKRWAASKINLKSQSRLKRSTEALTKNIMFFVQRRWKKEQTNKRMNRITHDSEQFIRDLCAFTYTQTNKQPLKDSFFGVGEVYTRFNIIIKYIEKKCGKCVRVNVWLFLVVASFNIFNGWHSMKWWFLLSSLDSTINWQAVNKWTKP